MGIINMVARDIFMFEDYDTYLLAG